MTQSKKTMSNRKIGQRFKELIKEFDGTQDVTAMYLNYCKTTISRYCSGEATIPDDVIKKVSKKWDVREEYIKCIDDYKTFSDVYFHGLDQERHDFGKIMNYLEILGFKLSFTYWITCPAAKYELFKDEVTPFIPTDSSDVFLCYPLEYEIGDKNSFLFDLFSLTEAEQLSKRNYMSIYLPFSNLKYTEYLTPKDIFKKHFNKIYEIPTTETIDFNNDCCCITVGYLVKNSDRDCGFFTIKQLEKLCYVINSHTKCCIDLFLSGRIF